MRQQGIQNPARMADVFAPSGSGHSAADSLPSRGPSRGVAGVPENSSRRLAYSFPRSPWECRSSPLSGGDERN